jgi:hypothetical protein
MRLSLKKGAHAILSSAGVQEIRGISLVFREMWDTQRHTCKEYTLRTPAIKVAPVRTERRICGFVASAS